MQKNLLLACAIALVGCGPARDAFVGDYSVKSVTWTNLIDGTSTSGGGDVSSMGLTMLITPHVEFDAQVHVSLVGTELFIATVRDAGHFDILGGNVDVSDSQCRYHTFWKSGLGTLSGNTLTIDMDGEVSVSCTGSFKTGTGTETIVATKTR